MKKEKNTKPRDIVKAKLTKAAQRLPKQSSEKNIDAVPLKEEVPQEFRETDLELENAHQPDTSVNSSQPEDRSEDLINETDPFIQQPEKDTTIPPELIQQRAYYLYEQRGGRHGQSVDDWLEAERQLRSEHNDKF